MRATAALVALLLSACATQQSLYTWGSYEDLIYVSYAEPGRLPPEAQVEKLEQDYQRARSANRRMPPGWHAHLGALYYSLGKPDQALQEFQTEKAEFPESAVFVERLMSNLRKA